MIGSPIRLDQCLLKAVLLAECGLLERAIETARQGLHASHGAGDRRQALERMQLELLLADLLAEAGRGSEAAAHARAVRLAASACGFDRDLTDPLLRRANQLLDESGA